MSTIMEASHQRTQRRSPAACPEPSHPPSPCAVCPGWVGGAVGRRRGGGGAEEERRMGGWKDSGSRGSHDICLFKYVSQARVCKSKKLVHCWNVISVMEAGHQRTQRKSPAACPEPSHPLLPYGVCLVACSDGNSTRSFWPSLPLPQQA